MVSIYRNSYFRVNNSQSSLLQENRLAVFDPIFISSLLPSRNDSLPAQDKRFILTVIKVDPSVLA